jgi:serine/threonine protein kinase
LGWHGVDGRSARKPGEFMSESEKSARSPANDTFSFGESGSTATVRDLTGLTLGDFQVERLLGSGGMGEVYLARQVSLNRPVALKVLRPDLLTKPTYLGRFEAEAAAVARLNHPNIVHVYMLGAVDGIRFIAMEYVQGTNLRTYIEKKGALDIPLALSIMRQAGVAIGAAGEVGLVHRDIKPENLLLTRKGQVKVADFGLCRDLDANNLHLTQTGVTMGTPQYMSPEQAQGHALDHRSDLYSLGVTFYHMLTGVPPFRAETALALALKHVKDTPTSLTVHRPEISADLDRLVLKLMAKNPDHRYQSSAEMLRDLAKIRDMLQAPSVAVPVSVSVAEAVSVGTAGNGTVVSPESPTAAAPRVTRSRVMRQLSGFRVGGRTLGLVVFACLVAGLLWGWFSRPPDLLSARAEQPDTVPGLWMEPDWQQIAQQPGADQQYRYAQIRVAAGDRTAAWVAVAGYYPHQRHACREAYVQLARRLLHRHDLQRLQVFAAELGRWKSAERPAEQELAVIVLAATKALEPDSTEEVLRLLGPDSLNPATLIDPALLELAAEVAAEASKAAAEGSYREGANRLNALQTKFQSQLLNNADFRDPLVGRGRPS